MITAGIDAGSRSIKAVLFDTETGCVVSSAIADQGVDQERRARSLFDRALESAAMDSTRVAGVVATGYGRARVGFAHTTITEITCHARGVYHLAPEARTIIEIGGQDSKVILLDGGGRVRDFSMNDRCAAGTGRFLEVVAERLEVSLETLGELSRQSGTPAIISSMCVVFAETEIIGLLAQGSAPSDIAAGVQNSIATRLLALAGRSMAGPVYFTGGVALQSGMVRALQDSLGMSVSTVPNPQFTGALGAAILAAAEAAGSR